METLKTISFFLKLIASLFTIGASGIAIYIYFFNRETISSALNVLLNYSQSLTLTELKYKLERLNDFNVVDDDHKAEVVNILHEILGQIRGNSQLKEQLADQLNNLEKVTRNSSSLTEPVKRSLVSELRESLRDIDAINYSEITKTKKSPK